MQSRLLLLVLLSACVIAFAYEPTWDSLDKRPTPSWFDESKFGIFIHWGVFSVPSWGNQQGGASGEWFWWNWKGAKKPEYANFMTRNYPPGFSYADFGPQFRAELWDPDAWAEIFAKSGAKYIVLTSKHHEGYTLWGSSVSWNWNSVDVGPHRDLAGDLAAAVRKQNLTMGFYHSLYEWFAPLYLADKASGWKSQRYVDEVLIPEMKELITNYKPAVLWTDGDWEAPPEYWRATDFLAWLFNESPVRDVVAVNDRWGIGCQCKHGGFWSGDDRYHPGKLVDHKWENCFTIDKHSWGFRRNARLEDYLTAQSLLKELVSTVAYGGNFLLNVGPAADGTLSPIFEERLLQLGSWLDLNGKAIYSTSPWPKLQNDTENIYYTANLRTKKLYITMFEYPTTSLLSLKQVPVSASTTSCTLLGVAKPVPLARTSDTTVTVTLPPMPAVSPLDYGFVLEIDVLA